MDEFDDEYPSVEHAYQAQKTLDRKLRKCFLTGNAGQAKRNGQRIELRKDWYDVSLNIMENLLKQKFSDNDLKQKLIETSDEELIEGNWWGDTFWGVCNGIGENHLGKLLMKVRGELKCPI
jgi:hypothetical protein